MQYIFITCISIFLFSCSTQNKIAKQTKAILVNDTALQNTNIGISIYDAVANKYLYNFNGDKYFVPASNTKILTCYAAMKYLSDSLVGLRYLKDEEYLEIQGTGDPSFLNDEFKYQPVFNFIKKANLKIVLNNNNWKEERWGNGWNWNDFNKDYCQERSVLPMYYNSVLWDTFSNGNYFYYKAKPKYFEKNLEVIDNTIDRTVNKAKITKDLFENNFHLLNSKQIFEKIKIPFTTGDNINKQLLKNIFQKEVFLNDLTLDKSYYDSAYNTKFSIIHSQPTDSILKPMMHRSDNFFAEQSLLMVSNEKLGYMNDAAIIDYIKKNDFVGIPQMPRWVDGCGLSRYNMATTQSIVWVLNKMKNEFGMERIKNIFATGGEGTISNYYKSIAGSIFAKTGTLSNHAALSGFLYTKKGKLLIFSTLTSGWQGSATPVRKAVEKYLLNLYTNY